MQESEKEGEAKGHKKDKYLIVTVAEFVEVAVVSVATVVVVEACKVVVFVVVVLLVVSKTTAEESEGGHNSMKQVMPEECKHKHMHTQANTHTCTTGAHTCAAHAQERTCHCHLKHQVILTCLVMWFQ